MADLNQEERREIIERLKIIPLYRQGKPPLTYFNIDMKEDLEETWGRQWGGQSSYAKLRAVVVQRPGPEACSKEAQVDPQFFSLPSVSLL